jgi:hypothetical protein
VPIWHVPDWQSGFLSPAAQVSKAAFQLIQA